MSLTHTIKRKTIIRLLLFLCICGGIRFCWNHYINVTTPENIRSIVLSHEKKLRTSALAELEAQGSANHLSLPGINEVRYLALPYNQPIVQYETGCRGFASQTSYYGFYYSPPNLPLGLNGEELDLPSSITAFQYELEGDNWYYTEKITDNWYYYEMHY